MKLMHFSIVQYYFSKTQSKIFTREENDLMLRLIKRGKKRAFEEVKERESYCLFLIESFSRDAIIPTPVKLESHF